MVGDDRATGGWGAESHEPWMDDLWFLHERTFSLSLKGPIGIEERDDDSLEGHRARELLPVSRERT